MESTALNKQIDDTRSRLKQIDASIEGTRAALNRTQLQLADAQDKFVRIQQLFQAGAVSQVEYEKARLLVETCRQNLNEQKSMLDRIEAQKAGLNQLLKQLTAEKHQLVVRSPVDGVVLDLPVKNGQIPPPGTLLASIAVPNQLEIKADILIDDLAGIQTGQKATITAPVLGDKILTGEVKEIYPQAYEKTSALGVIQRRVPVIISLTDTANLKPGYEVRVSIETFRKQNILVVPRQAVRTIAGGQQKVMVVVDNRVQHRFIETGITDGENVEVTSGLSAEELVILDGSMELAEGTKVNWE
jgi:HlyD family secretion protein